MQKHLVIDSHILVWLLYEPEKINVATIQILTAAEVIYVSTVSLWELAIKHNKGKLLYSPGDLAKGVDALGLTSLGLEASHVLALSSVQLPHQDPFDAMLLAQSHAERCVFVTADESVLQSKDAMMQDARV